jgi:hypothetical protein
VYFTAIWYILWLFGTFFPVLVCCTKKHLATLLGAEIILRQLSFDSAKRKKKFTGRKKNSRVHQIASGQERASKMGDALPPVRPDRGPMFWIKKNSQENLAKTTPFLTH